MLVVLAAMAGDAAPGTGYSNGRAFETRPIRDGKKRAKLAQWCCPMSVWSAATRLATRRSVRLWLTLGLLLWHPLASHAQGSATACDPALLRAYRELLALELGGHVEQAALLTLHCDATSAHVRLLRGQQVLGRSVPLAMNDAARWLALAGGELLRAEASLPREPSAVQLVAEAPRAARESTWTAYAAARVRLGDHPLTLRAGLELGAVAALRSWLALELALRFSSGAHAGLGPVRVRARDGGGALFVHHVLAHRRLRVLTGIGWTLGYTRLAAESRDPTVSAHRLEAAFTGPALALRALAAVLPRLWLWGGCEAAYLRPSLEGRNEFGDTSFRQRTWALAFTLGVSVPL